MESVARVIARRERLKNAIYLIRPESNLDAPALTQAAAAVMRLLPSGVRADAIYRSLSTLCGLKLSDPEIIEVCWSLAGNIEGLRRGEVVYPPKLPDATAIMPVQIIGCRRLPGRQRDHFRVLYRAKVLIGPGCPLTFDFNWSNRFVAYFAGRPDGLGFAGRKQSGLQYRHYSTLVGMRMLLSLDRMTGRNSVTQASCSPSFREHNQSLTLMRDRCGFSCPYSYTIPCHSCLKGQESCPAAVRSLDLISRLCGGCNRESDFDRYWPSAICVSCSARGRDSSPAQRPSQEELVCPDPKFPKSNS